jgi:hypothetical protein
MVAGRGLKSKSFLRRSVLQNANAHAPHGLRKLIQNRSGARVPFYNPAQNPAGALGSRSIGPASLHDTQLQPGGSGTTSRARLGDAAVTVRRRAAPEYVQ